MNIFVVIFVLILAVSNGESFDAPISIDECGAIAGVATESAALSNAKALHICLQERANPGGTVVVPEGSVYHILNFTAIGLNAVTLQIDGQLQALPQISSWPHPLKSDWAIMFFDRCSQLKLTGKGLVDGNGFNWWQAALFQDFRHRPRLVWVNRSSSVTVENLNFFDSPSYHLNMRDIRKLRIRNVTITVDLDGQRKLQQKRWRSDAVVDWQDASGGGGGYDTFPLNTDGIDVGATDVIIENCTITSFDDAVAVKPLNRQSWAASCSENQLIRNMTFWWGVGATIGSVPPDPWHACVRNVTFEDVRFYHPIKAVYVKTNPGRGTGEISEITYRRLHAHHSLWYPIYIGPQQQQQPGTKGTGCSFLYPVDPVCPTNPRVPIKGVTIEDSVFNDGVTLPGVILCNATRPCEDFVFRNVSNTGNFIISDQYASHNVRGIADNAIPVPKGFSTNDD